MVFAAVLLVRKAPPLPALHPCKRGGANKRITRANYGALPARSTVSITISLYA